MRYKSVRLDFNCPFPGVPLNTPTFTEADGFDITRSGDYVTISRGGESVEVHASHAVPMTPSIPPVTIAELYEPAETSPDDVPTKPDIIAVVRKGGWPKGKPRKPQP